MIDESKMTIAERLIYSTLYIEAHGPGGSSVGTGFAVGYQSEKAPYPVVVTNKHVVKGATSLTVRAVNADAGMPTKSAVSVTIETFTEESWLGHPDPDVDVAIFPLSQVIAAMTKLGKAPFILPIAPHIFLTDEDAEQLDVIEDVLFIGHPNGIYDPHSFLPITRRGITATPLQNDYEGNPAFLIDASIFPGSSGSPVFIYDKGPFKARNSEWQIGTRCILAGVVAAVHTREVDGKIILTRWRPVARFDDLLDLGIVYKASAIQETVDLLSRTVNLELKPYDPMASSFSGNPT